MINTKKCLCILWGIAFGFPLTAQIYLDNPSFEGQPQDATVPVGWLPCQPGTTPDILPGVWGVYQEASEGDTFVGLITRSDGTYESITQRLRVPVRPKTCLSFSLDLARSDTYAGYSQPLKIRIWGSNHKCKTDQLLYESDRIEDTEWATHVVSFTAQTKINYLLIEAFHTEEQPFSYTGNILIDNITPLRPCVRVYVPEGKRQLAVLR